MPTFDPLIEEDFLMTKDFKKKKPFDEKEVKRKLKRTEKDALRELRKDTQHIQIQRDKENEYKRNMFKKTVVKAGTLKDEI